MALLSAVMKTVAVPLAAMALSAVPDCAQAPVKEASPEDVCSFITAKMKDAAPGIPAFCAPMKAYLPFKYNLSVFSTTDVLHCEMRRTWSVALFEAAQELFFGNALNGFAVSKLVSPVYGEMQSQLSLEQLGPDQRVGSADLRECLGRNPWRDGRPRYLVRCGGKEVAFFAFDVAPPDIVLYEFFVGQPFRRRGIGSRLLEKAAEEARRYECVRMLVRPGQLSPDHTVEALAAWYQKRGFIAVPGEGGLLQFALSAL